MPQRIQAISVAPDTPRDEGAPLVQTSYTALQAAPRAINKLRAIFQARRPALLPNKVRFSDCESVLPHTARGLGSWPCSRGNCQRGSITKS